MMLPFRSIRDRRADPISDAGIVLFGANMNYVQLRGISPRFPAFCSAISGSHPGHPIKFLRSGLI